MIKTTLSQLAISIDAKLYGGDAEVNNIYTDSRGKIDKGLFVALKGDNFDAHNFLDIVSKQGAIGAVVEQHNQLNIPQLVVKNSQLALGEIAHFNRTRLKAKIIAVTGSSGKTTVKEMIASILRGVGKTYATKGNLNNEIGAPLSLLDMDETDEFGVIELGASRAGDIDYTVKMVEPDVAVINNVAAAHLEGFGDLNGVASAKGEIYSGLKKRNGIAIINNDDAFAGFWKKQLTQNKLLVQKIITFSKKGAADLVAKNVKLDVDQCAQFEIECKTEKEPVHLNLTGSHNVNNALAAAACCIALGVSLKKIAKGLSQVPSIAGRLNIQYLSNGCRLIDDTYNANIESMKVAINLLSRYQGRKILVIGDMAELGKYENEMHEQLGRLAVESKIDVLYSYGKLTQLSQKSFAGEGEHFVEQALLIKQLKQEINSDTTILIKGSRSAAMENVVTALVDSIENNNNKLSSNCGGF